MPGGDFKPSEGDWTCSDAGLVLSTWPGDSFNSDVSGVATSTSLDGQAATDVVLRRKKIKLKSRE